MKSTCSLGAFFCAALLITGCGKSDDTSLTPPPAPKPPEQAAVAAAQSSVAPPATAAPTTPPPAGSAVAPAPEADSGVIKDPDGKTLTAISYLQSLVDGYNRTRAGQSDGTPWPPLTDLQQLVNMRMIARLPTAPAGQKFVFDAATGKVTLAPK